MVTKSSGRKMPVEGNPGMLHGHIWRRSAWWWWWVAFINCKFCNGSGTFGLRLLASNSLGFWAYARPLSYLPLSKKVRHAICLWFEHLMVCEMYFSKIWQGLYHPYWSRCSRLDALSSQARIKKPQGLISMLKIPWLFKIETSKLDRSLSINN